MIVVIQPSVGHLPKQIIVQYGAPAAPAIMAAQRQANPAAISSRSIPVIVAIQPNAGLLQISITVQLEDLVAPAITEAQRPASQETISSH